MPWRACSFCRKRFIGKAVSAYHRWWEGETPQAWRQSACDACAKTKFDFIFKYAKEQSEFPESIPDKCMNCGGSLDDGVNLIYHNFFQGKAERNLIAVLCNDDLTLAAPRLIEGATRLEDRADATRGGDRGASSQETLASLGRELP